jgi:hypothetical protein
VSAASSSASGSGLRWLMMRSGRVDESVESPGLAEGMLMLPTGKVERPP